MAFAIMMHLANLFSSKFDQGRKEMVKDDNVPHSPVLLSSQVAFSSEEPLTSLLFLSAPKKENLSPTSCVKLYLLTPTSTGDKHQTVTFIQLFKSTCSVLAITIFAASRISRNLLSFSHVDPFQYSQSSPSNSKQARPQVWRFFHDITHLLDSRASHSSILSRHVRQAQQTSYFTYSTTRSILDHTLT
jgi:hypothetical protein